MPILSQSHTFGHGPRPLCGLSADLFALGSDLMRAAHPAADHAPTMASLSDMRYDHAPMPSDLASYDERDKRGGAGD